MLTQANCFYADAGTKSEGYSGPVEMVGIRRVGKEARSGSEPGVAQGEAQSGSEPGVAQEEEQSGSEPGVAQEQGKQSGHVEKEAWSSSEPGVAQEEAQSGSEPGVAQEEAQSGSESGVAQEQGKQSGSEPGVAQEKALSGSQPGAAAKEQSRTLEAGADAHGLDGSAMRVPWVDLSGNDSEADADERSGVGDNLAQWYSDHPPEGTDVAAEAEVAAISRASSSGALRDVRAKGSTPDEAWVMAAARPGDICEICETDIAWGKQCWRKSAKFMAVCMECGFGGVSP